MKIPGWSFWRLAGKWVFIVAIGLVILGLALMEGFDRYVSSDRGAKWLYRKTPREVQVLRTASGLRYLQIGDPEKPALLLLHGSPGSVIDWRGFARDERVYQQYRLLIAERPGYGGTSPRRAERSIIEQASRCLEVLQGEDQPAEVMGYSYGAPVGLAMAGMEPERISRFIGVAGQFDPENEMTMGISYVVRFQVFRFLLPRWLWVSNEEKLGHPDALRDALPIFSDVKCTVDLIHGHPDAIVPYGNSPWLQDLLPSITRLYSLNDIGHEVPFQNMDTLVQFALNPEQFFLPGN